MPVAGTAPAAGPASAGAAAAPAVPPVAVHRCGGDPARGRMLLLHGLANSASVWDAYLGAAARDDGPEIWAAELPWRGDAVARCSAQGDVVPYLAEALRAVPGGAGVVMGHSMGANGLLEFLSRRLAHGVDPFTEFGIRGLILVSPFYRRTAEDFTWQCVETAVRNFVQIMEDGVRVHAGDRLPPELARELGGRVRDRVGAYGWFRFFETYLATPKLRTGGFTVPCLVVAGEHDFAAPPAEGRLLAADLPDAEFHQMSDSGHFLMIEQAAGFAAVVDRFVSAVPAAPASGGPGPTPSGEHLR
ncbi:alpha/beta fold hydrolase [Kitasatospora sp. NPDC090091]|uniref:alpha/beta fold hydrolase n=1 Tax=Kitasatospora sp. NPDC090091 TaxID=3364081 RepID=UPI0037F7FE1A